MIKISEDINYTSEYQETLRLNLTINCECNFDYGYIEMPEYIKWVTIYDDEVEYKLNTFEDCQLINDWLADDLFLFKSLKVYDFNIDENSFIGTAKINAEIISKTILNEEDKEYLYSTIIDWLNELDLEVNICGCGEFEMRSSYFDTSMMQYYPTEIPYDDDFDINVKLDFKSIKKY